MSVDIKLARTENNVKSDLQLQFWAKIGLLKIFDKFLSNLRSVRFDLSFAWICDILDVVSFFYNVIAPRYCEIQMALK